MARSGSVKYTLNTQLLASMVKSKVNEVDKTFSFLDAIELTLDLIPSILENRRNYSKQWVISTDVLKLVCKSSSIIRLDNELIFGIKDTVLGFLNNYRLNKSLRVIDYDCSAYNIKIEVEYENTYYY